MFLRRSRNARLRARGVRGGLAPPSRGLGGPSAPQGSRKVWGPQVSQFYTRQTQNLDFCQVNFIAGCSNSLVIPGGRGSGYTFFTFLYNWGKLLLYLGLWIFTGADLICWIGMLKCLCLMGFCLSDKNRFMSSSTKTRFHFSFSEFSCLLLRYLF